MSERGKQFELEVATFLQGIPNSLVLREGEIIKKYGKELSGVDVLVETDSKRIYVQCKWEASTPSIRDINHFVATCESISQKAGYKKFQAYFLSRCPSSMSGMMALEEKLGFSLLDAGKEDNFAIAIEKLRDTVNTFCGISLEKYAGALHTKVSEEEAKKKSEIEELEKIRNELIERISDHCRLIPNYHMFDSMKFINDSNEFIRMASWKKLNQLIEMCIYDYNTSGSTYCVCEVMNLKFKIKNIRDTEQKLNTLIGKKKYNDFIMKDVSPFDQHKTSFAGKSCWGVYMNEKLWKSCKTQEDIGTLYRALNSPKNQLLKHITSISKVQ